MWPFIFILAIVPMVFYWSDSVVTLFPQLAQYLPDKGDKGTGPQGQVATLEAAQGAGTTAPGKWIKSSSEAGYVAWVLSSDGQYRLAVGCRKAMPPTLQITHISGKPLPHQLVIDFQYGQVLVTAGAYTGPDLVNAAAQFGAMNLQTPDQPAQVITRFNPDRVDSGLTARELQQCL